MASDMQAIFRQCFAAPALRSYAAESISTFFFVFTAVGSAISARMLTPDVTSDASSLIATAVAQGFALFVAIFMAVDVSGGHVNPAVTFAFALGGHIAVPVAIFYWISQMLAATFACLLLRVASSGQAIPTTKIATRMTGFGAAVIECITTFMLVYTIHVACDPRLVSSRKKSRIGGILAIGFVAGAGVLATGSLTGGSMNPARSFGSAVVSGEFQNQAVYWVGPFLGAAFAALVHQNLVYPNTSSQLSDTQPGNGSGEVIV
ncbi:Tonoplast intrinsic protein 2 [Rhynchospora pubera]|uniref:Tonoplast intrinsic protein 2 n=1 Tax=Rhynchospora pubera TaxID=906938 RepID=A0AAV8BU94_9POAL|nr:Tonoplast intrinsic protein 2 [Rhynchospora pubera]